MNSTPNALLNMLKNHRVFRIEQWGSSYDYNSGERRVETDNMMFADVVTSEIKGGARYWGTSHRVMLDIDVPAFLIESSTPGHSHLYIDKEIGEKAYFNLLEALTQCGIIESGYYLAAQRNKHTSLRLPWVKK